MLARLGIAIAIPIVIYGILYLLSLLRKKRTPPPKTTPEPAPEVPVVAPVALPVFPFADIHEVPIPGSELCYCKPFGPADSMADVWCKLQTFVSGDPIVVRVGSLASPPLFKSGFSPDGAVHSSRTMFTDEFANRMQRQNWQSISRQVRALSGFGVPPDASEGSYQIYIGPLFIDLKGALLKDARYNIQAVFEPNLGLVPNHFAGDGSYLSCPMESGDSSNPQETTVGFPFTLARLILTSESISETAPAPEFVEELRDGYGKYVLADPVTQTAPSTQTGITISDGIVVISISEKFGADGNKAFRITYHPTRGGPLDAHAAADQHFGDFAKSIGERLRTPAAAQLKTPNTGSPEEQALTPQPAASLPPA